VRVQFTPSARRQFLAALQYIRRDDPLAARKFRKKAELSLRPLGRFSESGRVIPEFSDLPFREVIVAPYRFFYRVDDRKVWIGAVWHGAQLADDPSR
jgi:toxin ParE1/3/4